MRRLGEIVPRRSTKTFTFECEVREYFGLGPKAYQHLAFQLAFLGGKYHHFVRVALSADKPASHHYTICPGMVKGKIPGSKEFVRCATIETANATAS